MMKQWSEPEEHFKEPVDYYKVLIPVTLATLVSAFGLQTYLKHRKKAAIEINKPMEKTAKPEEKKSGVLKSGFLNKKPAKKGKGGPKADSPGARAKSESQKAADGKILELLKNLPKDVKVGKDAVLEEELNYYEEDKKMVEYYLDCEDLATAMIVCEQMFERFMKKMIDKIHSLEGDDLEHYFFLVLTMNRLYLFHDKYDTNIEFLWSQMPYLERSTIMKINLFKSMVTCYEKLKNLEAQLDAYNEVLALIDELSQEYTEEQRFVLLFQFQDVYIQLLDVQTEAKRYTESLRTLDTMINAYTQIDRSAKTLCILVEHKAILLNILGRTDEAIDCIETYIRELYNLESFKSGIEGAITLVKRLALLYIYENNHQRGLELLETAVHLAEVHGINPTEFRTELCSTYYMSGDKESARLLECEIIGSEFCDDLSFRSTYFTTNKTSIEVSSEGPNSTCKLSLYKKISGFNAEEHKELYNLRPENWLVARFSKHPLNEPIDDEHFENPIASIEQQVNDDETREVNIEALLFELEPSDVIATEVLIYESSKKEKLLGRQYNLIRATPPANCAVTEDSLFISTF